MPRLFVYSTMFSVPTRIKSTSQQGQAAGRSAPASIRGGRRRSRPGGQDRRPSRGERRQTDELLLRNSGTGLRIRKRGDRACRAWMRASLACRASVPLQSDFSDFSVGPSWPAMVKQKIMGPFPPWAHGVGQPRHTLEPGLNFRVLSIVDLVTHRGEAMHCG